MIARTRLAPPPRIGLESNGMLMTPDEFDAIEDYDHNYTYELMHGVLIVGFIADASEVGPNQLLGYRLHTYRQDHAQGKSLDATLPERYVSVANGRRKADRVIWAGLGRMPIEREDPPTIAVELVSQSKRDRRRDFEEKLAEYPLAEVKEYWIIDCFQRQMHAYRFYGRKRLPFVTSETGTYTTPLLSGFELALAPILRCADCWTEPKRRRK
jgi:Uma2 family endonuclease